MAPVPVMLMFPAEVTVPVKLGDASVANPRLVSAIVPTVTHAEFAELRIFSKPVVVSAQSWNANVVVGALAPLFSETIADRALLRSALTFAPESFAIE